MASNTSRIIDLEAQMAYVQLQLDSHDQDLKTAIAELAVSTKDNMDALAASFARSREKSPIGSPSHSQDPVADQHKFRQQQQRRPSILDHYPRLGFSYFSGSDPHVWVIKCNNPLVCRCSIHRLWLSPFIRHDWRKPPSKLARRRCVQPLSVVGLLLLLQRVLPSSVNNQLLLRR
ncbi:unnamed protein product [Linum trigynum]|uniref:Uncharacterized protein n=1 Tax=Linum trigynum TaxID=586398 RepID=A0AAV2E1B0_9ROSI